MKYLLFLTAMLIGVITSAQVVTASIEDRSRYLLHTIKWTTREKQGFQDGNTIIQVEKTGIKVQSAFSVRMENSKHGITIRKMDASGKDVSKNEIEGGERVFGPIQAEPIMFGDKILLFYFRYSEKDSMRLFVSEVDESNLELTNTQQLFSYAQGNAGLLKIMKALDRKISLRSSPDLSKLLVVFPDVNEQLFTCVFDNSLKVLRTKVSKLPGIDKLKISGVYFDNNSGVNYDNYTGIYIDNKGNAIVAFSREEASFETFNNTIAKKILIQKADNSERMIDVEALGGGKELHNMRFEGSEDGAKVYVFGDYAGEVANAGVWLSEIQTEKFNVSKTKMFPYPEEFKKQVDEIGFAKRKRGEYGIYDADFRMAEFADGSLAICGSPLYLEEKGADAYTRIKYLAGPIMVMLLSGQQPPIFTMVPRYQEFSEGSASIYIPFGEKLIIVYNDYTKNINKKPGDIRMKGIVRAVDLDLAAAVINKSGTLESRKMLTEGVSKKNFFNTSGYEFLSPGKVAIPSALTDKKTDEMKVAVVTVE